MLIYIIILHYSPSKELHDYSVNLTLACIESVIKTNNPNLTFSKGEMGGLKNIKIILIDNNEGLDFPLEQLEKIPSMVGERSRSITFIKNEKNTGFAAGVNIGIKIALQNNADYIFLLNNDAFIDKFMFDEFLKYTEDEKTGILCGKIYYEGIYFGDNFNYMSWYEGGKIDWLRGRGVHINEAEELLKKSMKQFDELYGKPKETDFATGCAMFVKREVFEKIGLLDEKYFLYFEDLDFCVRAKKAGYKIKYIPDAKIWHIVGASSIGNSALSVYYQNRNRLIFMRKHASLINLFIFFIIYILGFIRRILFALIKKDKEKVEANIKALKDGLMPYKNFYTNS